MRKPYLDNTRWGTVLLVLVYHVLYVFNASGVLGGIGRFYDVQYQDALLYFVYPWFMVLLFVVAGISSRYALEKQPHKEFISARTRKLLVPSTLGLLVFQWITGYFNMAASGAFAYMGAVPGPILYLIMAVSGIGPLWFIQMLWLFSLLLVLLRKIDKNDKFYDMCGKAFGDKWGILPLLLLALVIWGAAQIGNVPVITTYRFGIYGIAYLLGYFVLSHDKVQETLEKLALPLGIAAVILGVAYVICYFGQNYTDAPILQNFFTNSYLWVAVLGILGCGKKCLNGTSKFSQYMTKASFGIYVTHYLPLIAAAYLLKTYTTLPALVIYLITAVCTFGGSVLLYEVIRRIPVLRWCVLGIKKKK